jgi:hypothetical protein
VLIKAYHIRLWGSGSVVMFNVHYARYVYWHDSSGADDMTI